MSTTALREDLRVRDAELGSAAQRLEEHAGGLVKHGLLTGFAVVGALVQTDSPYASNDDASVVVLTVYRLTHDALQQIQKLAAEGHTVGPQLRAQLTELLGAADRFPVSTNMSPLAYRRWSGEFQEFRSILRPLAEQL